MRKLLPIIINTSITNGMALPPLLQPLDPFVNSSRLFTPLPSSSSPLLSSPSPSPSPSPYSLRYEDIRDRQPQFAFPSVPFVDSAFDVATLSIIAALILLSILSLSFILHLRLRSRRLQHLQNFNSFWTVRLLLVMFAFLWALNEVLRLPFLRRKYLYPFLPTLNLNQQAGLCKVHVVLSFGFLQPGFLVTLLFLVSISIQKKNPRCMLALASVFVICFPILLLQTFFVFFSPLEALLPKFMHVSSILTSDVYGNKTVLCTYPLLSCMIFGGFAIGYSLGFLLSCWRVASFVINKSIRFRINVLTFTVMSSLPVQLLCLAISPLWMPQETTYGFVTLAMFLAVAFCVSVGEVILVIRPIADALAAGGDCCQWSREIRLGRPQVDRNQNQ